MVTWQRAVAGLLTVTVLAGFLRAQPALPTSALPGVGSPPAVPSAVPAVPSTMASSPQTLWGFLGLTKANFQACHQKFCQCQLGQLMSSMVKPATALSGGIVPALCPTNVPTAAELNQAGAGGVAAKIKKEEAEAKARRADIQYLATVDCHYYPEAEKALINALRADRNECVRWEAAKALGTGCCCSRKTIEALLLTVTGSNKDGNPAETSPRVRDAASESLQHCLACVTEVVAPPAPSERPERPPESPPSAALQGTSIQLAAGEVPAVEAGTVEPPPLVQSPAPPSVPMRSSLTPPTGRRDLYDIMRTARQQRPTQ